MRTAGPKGDASETCGLSTVAVMLTLCAARLLGSQAADTRYAPFARSVVNAAGSACGLLSKAHHVTDAVDGLGGVGRH